jgi:hypothetical protein
MYVPLVRGNITILPGGRRISFFQANPSITMSFVGTHVGVLVR